MANNKNTNPIVLDTFTADYTIAEHTIPVKSVIFKSSNVDDELVLTGIAGGVEVLRLSVETANKTVVWTPAAPVMFRRLTLDVSEGTYVGTCKALIFS